MIDLNALELNIFSSLSPSIAETSLILFFVPLSTRLHYFFLYRSMKLMNRSSWSLGKTQLKLKKQKAKETRKHGT